jgi:hypothetical protein
MVTNMNLAGNTSGLMGLSTDTKPTTGLSIGSTFYEIDTRKWLDI